MVDEALQRDMEAARRYAQGKQDVITIAKSCRGGTTAIEVLPLNNGWMVSLRPTQPEIAPQNIVFMRADKLGTFIHTLFSSNLDNPTVQRRLRLALGYL